MAVALPREEPGGGGLARARVTLGDGASPAVYSRLSRAQTELRVGVLRRPQRLEPGYAARGVDDALVGGFFLRPAGVPLGEVRTRGVARRTRRSPPLGRVRACVHIDGGRSRIAQPRRASRPAPRRPPAGRPAARARRRAVLRARARPRGLLRRPGAVRLRHHRRPPSARRARARARPPPRGRLRRALAERRRADARGAGRAAGRARLPHGAQPRRRRVDVAGQRRAAAQPAARGGRPAGARWQRPRARRRCCSPPR